MADEFGDGKVIWKSKNGPIRVSLSNTLIAEEMSLCLLSIPALVKRVKSVLLNEWKALLIDMKNNFSIISTAKQADDGLFYISDMQEEVSTAKLKPGESILA